MPDDRNVFRMDLGSTDYVLHRCDEIAERASVLLHEVFELLILASPHLPAVQLSAPADPFPLILMRLWIGSSLLLLSN